MQQDLYAHVRAHAKFGSDRVLYLVVETDVIARGFRERYLNVRPAFDPETVEALRRIAQCESPAAARPEAARSAAAALVRYAEGARVLDVVASLGKTGSWFTRLVNRVAREGADVVLKSRFRNPKSGD